MNDHNKNNSIIKEQLIKHELFSKLLCGAIAGVTAKTVIAPGELIKMSFQLTSETFTLKNAYNKLILRIKNKGFFSLWSGHSANVLRVAPYAALHYSIHDSVEYNIKQHNKNQNNKHNKTILNNKVIIQLISGSLAGGGATLITYPLDVMRVRIAFNNDLNNKLNKKSFFNLYKNAISSGGLYQGFVPTMLGVVPYAGTAWCAKDLGEYYMNQLLCYYHFNRKINTSERLFINAIAGLIGQLVTYPLDVVRRRMQMAGMQLNHIHSNTNVNTNLNTNSNTNIKNMREVLISLYKTEGIKGLTKGYSLNIIKGPITLSISLTVYDLTQNWIKM